VFLEPTPTQFDLKFRLFGTPVRVHPTFWLFSAIFGWNFLNLGFGYLALWIGCMFLSILVHEFGHVIMGRICYRPGHIILYSFGGLAVGDYQVRHRWQRIAISFAGPAAGFLLYGLILLARNYALPQFGVQVLVQNPAILVAISMLLWMNLVWNVLNLIPIFPLDGGQISREVFSGMFPDNGLRLSLGLSLVLAGLGAVYSILVINRKELPYPSIDPQMAAIMLGFLAIYIASCSCRRNTTGRTHGGVRDELISHYFSLLGGTPSGNSSAMRLLVSFIR
jgi:stage IV sporulation protein FB